MGCPSDRSSHHARLAVKVRSLAISFLVVAATVAAYSQPALDTPFGEEVGVTSVDLWVGAPSGAFHRWWSGSKTRQPSFDDLRLVVGGSGVTITSVETSKSDKAPWQILIWFDAALGDERGLRWAALALSERAGVLAEKGSVQMVVADPDPRLIVAPSAGKDVLEASLSDLAILGEASDQLRIHRQDFLEESLELEGEALDELARLYAAAEIDFILGQQDRLLEWLAETTEPGARRLLIYVGNGFERPTARFYGLEEADDLSPLLEEESLEWTRAVASYDWTTVAMVPEDPPALVRKGVTIGRWRFRWGFPFIVGAYEGERDPELAKAFVELGDSELVAGNLAAADAAYRKAIHHYHGDDATRVEQGAASLKLAEVLVLRNDPGAARLHFFNALALDPDLETVPKVEWAPFLDSVAVLEELAADTGGLVVRRSRDLEGAIRDLEARRRLSFELQGLPRGERLSLALESGDGGAVYLHRKWVRSGTPPRVARARLRDFLRESEDEPDLPQGLSAKVNSRGFSLAPAPEPEPEQSPYQRRLLAFSSDEDLLRVVPMTLGGSHGRDRWHAEIPDDAMLDFAAVYSEDLPSGEWSVLPLEIE